jgi:uncharacterized protein (DUF1697 family)
MPWYAALLRGVSPVNLKMPELTHALNAMGFKGVKTVLASGNVVFSGPRASETTVARKVEAAIEKHMAKKFPTIVRTIEDLEKLLEQDPFSKYRVSPKAKRVVTFLRSKPETNLALPIERDGARILALHGLELLSAYEQSPKGPVFMTLIERAYGKDVTTRTWETVQKIVRAAANR